ncbi:GNAT family N-acetyltransferase [Burkholderia pyrrocinia]
MDKTPQPTLAGEFVQLRPLRPEDAPDLVAAAADGDLWNLKVTIVPTAGTVDAYIAAALQGQQNGTTMPFAIIHRATDRIVGSTRFWQMDRESRKLEIGYTWLSASAQRTAINTEAKYLLLRYAFEHLNCVRVQLGTDELNEQSRAAILRIGAKLEGIVRHERIMPDGRKRNSALFSIIDSEWPGIKTMLEGKLGKGSSS